MGNDCKTGTEISSGGEEKAPTLESGGGSNIMNVLNATELYTLKWKTVWYVYIV